MEKLERATTQLFAITVVRKATSPTSATPTRRTRANVKAMLGKEKEETKEKEVERPTKVKERETKEKEREHSSGEK